MENFPDFLKSSNASLKALLCAIPREETLLRIEIPFILSSFLASAMALIISDNPTSAFSEKRFSGI